MRSGEKIQKREKNAKPLRSKETVAVSRGTKSPSALFRNWRRGGRFRRRGRRRYVLFDQVPKHCCEQDGHQLRAPVFQGQSGAQKGKQLRAPVFRGRSLRFQLISMRSLLVILVAPFMQRRDFNRSSSMSVAIVYTLI